MDVTSREIPKHLRQRSVFVTHGDGEVSYAGVDVIVWRATLNIHLLQFSKVLREIRMIWTSQHKLFDAIFQVILERSGGCG